MLFEGGGGARIYRKCSPATLLAAVIKSSFPVINVASRPGARARRVRVWMRLVNWSFEAQDTAGVFSISVLVEMRGPPLSGQLRSARDRIFWNQTASVDLFFLFLFPPPQKN